MAQKTKTESWNIHDVGYALLIVQNYMVVGRFMFSGKLPFKLRMMMQAGIKEGDEEVILYGKHDDPAGLKEEWWWRIDMKGECAVQGGWDCFYRYGEDL